MSDGPAVVLPVVDLHEYLPPITSLLTATQNAAIHKANFQYGALIDAPIMPLIEAATN